MINADLLEQMKPSGFLINTARGGLVGEPALLSALKAQQIGGAALDVLSVEPPPENHVLLNAKLPNLLITPHNAWVGKRARQTLLDSAVKALTEHLSHRRSNINE
jgi:glycerate dehydrogenase